MPTTTHNPKANLLPISATRFALITFAFRLKTSPVFWLRSPVFWPTTRFLSKPLIQKEAPPEPVATEIILLTQSTREADIQRAIRTMQQLANVRGAIVLLRKEELQ